MLVRLQQEIGYRERQQLLVSGGAKRRLSFSPNVSVWLQDWPRGAEGHKRGAKDAAAAEPLPTCGGLWGHMPARWDLTALQGAGAPLPQHPFSGGPSAGSGPISVQGPPQPWRSHTSPFTPFHLSVKEGIWVLLLQRRWAWFKQVLGHPRLQLEPCAGLCLQGPLQTVVAAVPSLPRSPRPRPAPRSSLGSWSHGRLGCRPPVTSVSKAGSCCLGLTCSAFPAPARLGQCDQCAASTCTYLLAALLQFCIPTIAPF